ncbi:hypothetical protein BDV37DRAFT_3642 [Aspergillus pseudonomiae]|uniref:Uncharacterized protein n=1 Tax=Aspergillus pseudonomiae TaxID=1506151 RepID=A0A5N7DUI5_9EURO|nr:uncharacterized protein BDV37DRAFT_3642 [Aspergillus pseudonomiae]KAE8410074.1 hypothetical protein BDV37DRAFT_3642 [Aspergillus pseudonomiae]
MLCVVYVAFLFLFSFPFSFGDWRVLFCFCFSFSFSFYLSSLRFSLVLGVLGWNIFLWRWVWLGMGLETETASGMDALIPDTPICLRGRTRLLLHIPLDTTIH